MNLGSDKNSPLVFVGSNFGIENKKGAQNQSKSPEKVKRLKNSEVSVHYNLAHYGSN